MKIVKIEKAEAGVSEHVANNLWSKIEKFAAYSFNKSHSVAYSILSYWTCYVKTYYPAEYFAAQLSIVKEDKYPNLIKDARSCKINVLPPDVNFSTDKFAIKDPWTIVMPFSAIKGCSENIAKKIMKAREDVGGHFITKMHFEEIASQKGSGINCRVVANLDRVGAFAGIEPSQPMATDESRLKDQIELMPGLVIDTIVSTATTNMDDNKKLEILNIFSEVVNCKGCDLCSKTHPSPIVGGSKCRFMMVFDCPNGDEETKGKMFVGSGANFVKKAFKEAGVSTSQGYFTSLVKAKKSDKFLTNAQLNGCTKWLDKEVETVKPGVIVCMGSASTKHFLPNVKSPSAEVGNAYFDKKLDATIIVGMNPLQIVFDPKKMELLDKIAAKLSETLG